VAGFSWPLGQRAAAALTFDVDAESAILSFAPEAADRMTVMSHQAYGPRVGVPRLLRLLDRHDVKATFFVPGYTAHGYPDVVRQIVDHGHEVAHHGYLHETLVGVSAEKEEEILLRGIDALVEVAGVRPVGYRAPMWELNFHSAGLLHKHGFLYDSSLMDSDVPYELAVSPGSSDSVVEIPISWSADDWGQFCFLPELSGTGMIESPTKTLEMWRMESEAMHAEGGCFVLVNHPFLSGRPARAAAIEKLVEHLAGLDGMWVTTMAAIAEHTRSLQLTPVTCERPVVPSG
jgi:peptidoglycan/xylan/chitin deacetylase (PgdA/CDA1 family)